MDDTDRKLVLVIEENPRMHIQEIAERLGITRQTVHQRVLALSRCGVFSSIKPIISVGYLDGVHAAVWGKSKSTSIEKTLDKLGKNEFVGRVVVAGGYYLYVLGCLRDTSELAGYLEFIRREAEIPEPILGMADVNNGILPDWASGAKRKDPYRKLSLLDLKIITSLMGNVRRPSAEIANILGVSSKTIQKHLDRMRLDGSLDFDEPWDVPVGENMLTVLQITIGDDANKVGVARRLMSKDPIHMNYLRSFSNIPCFLLGFINSDRMSQIRWILREIEEDEDVRSVTPNLVYLERPYSNWIERMPEVFIRSYEEGRKGRKSL